MITHLDVAAAHERAQELDKAVRAANQRAANPEASLFTRAYSEAKHREAREAMVTAAALARWASWRAPGVGGGL